MLVSHLSGIRHYKKVELIEKEDDEVMPKEKEKDAEQAAKKEKKKHRDTEFEEIYMTKRFKSVEEALSLFQKDQLFHKPGRLLVFHSFKVQSCCKDVLTYYLCPNRLSLSLYYLWMDCC